MCPFHTLKRAYVINSTELVFLRLRHQHATIKLFSFIVVFEAEIDMSDKEFRIYFDYQTLDYKNQFSFPTSFIDDIIIEIFRTSLNIHGCQYSNASKNIFFKSNKS